MRPVPLDRGRFVGPERRPSPGRLGQPRSQRRRQRSPGPRLERPDQLLGADDATVRTVLNSWGPGKFDAELLLDGKAFRPDGQSGAVLIPPAFGLAGVNLGTWTGYGQTTYWNAFVANL